MQRFFEGKKWMLAVAILLAGGYTRAQGTQDTLTLIAGSKYFGHDEPYHYGTAVQYRRPDREDG